MVDVRGAGNGVRLPRQTCWALRRTAPLNLQEAVTDDRLAVALVEVAGRAGSETLDGERAVPVLRVQDGRFVEFWSHHYDHQKMNRAWS
jgi:hypothetical protein